MFAIAGFQQARQSPQFDFPLASIALCFSEDAGQAWPQWLLFLPCTVEVLAWFAMGLSLTIVALTRMTRFAGITPPLARYDLTIADSRVGNQCDISGDATATLQIAANIATDFKSPESNQR